MKYFLDTNICVYYLKGRNENLKRKLLKEHPDNIKIPSIVKAELLYGAEKSKYKKDNIIKINEFLLPFEIIPFSDLETDRYAKTRATLESKGKTIGPNDLIIASIVMEHDGILITNNINEFERIKEMKIENWME